MSTSNNIDGEPILVSGLQDGDILVRNAQGTPFWENQQPSASSGGAAQMVGNLRRQEIDDLLLGIEVKLGGFQFDPLLFPGSSIVLGALVALTDAGGAAPTLDLRLYDMGTSLAPQAGDLRATRTFSITGQLRFEQTFLTPVAGPLTPNDNSGDILNSARLYEVRAELNGDVGDLAEIDWAGIQGV